MPIYEYECEKNGHRFEVQQKISDPPVTVCQICQAPVRRLISETSFVLKGSGWYADAYSSGGKKSSSASKESGVEKLSDSKPKEDSGKKDAPAPPPKPSTK